MLAEHQNVHVAEPVDEVVGIHQRMVEAPQVEHGVVGGVLTEHRPLQAAVVPKVGYSPVGVGIVPHAVAPTVPFDLDSNHPGLVDHHVEMLVRIVGRVGPVGGGCLVGRIVQLLQRVLLNGGEPDVLIVAGRRGRWILTDLSVIGGVAVITSVIEVAGLSCQAVPLNALEGDTGGCDCGAVRHREVV